MVYTLSYQMYKYAHGVTAAKQRAEAGRAGEAAMTASAPVSSGVR